MSCPDFQIARVDLELAHLHRALQGAEYGPLALVPKRDAHDGLDGDVPVNNRNNVQSLLLALRLAELQYEFTKIFF